MANYDVALFCILRLSEQSQESCKPRGMNMEQERWELQRDGNFAQLLERIRPEGHS